MNDTAPSPTDEHTNSVRKPLIRWAGGKRVIVPKLFRFVPKNFGTYYEPLIGSGALFFALNPRRAVVADVNPELINFYTVVKDNPHEFFRAVQKLTASKRTYYRIRATTPSSALLRAVRFFYLIRLSWNALYRVNRAGQFNVPFGGRTPRQLVGLSEILEASTSLKRARLLCNDFEKVSPRAKDGDFVYFDPPYPKGASDNNGFARYHATQFDFDDHKRMFCLTSDLVQKGVKVLITEAATKKILDLYQQDFYITIIRSRSLIAAKGEHRGDVSEAIITRKGKRGQAGFLALQKIQTIQIRSN